MLVTILYMRIIIIVGIMTNDDDDKTSMYSKLRENNIIHTHS